MTNDQSALCAVVMKDLLALHRTRQCLAGVHEGIQQTNLSGKHAMLVMLDQADDVICSIIKKASKRAIANGLKGHYAQYDIPQDLIEYMAGFAPTPAEKKEAKKHPGRKWKQARPAELAEEDKKAS